MTPLVSIDVAYAVYYTGGPFRVKMHYEGYTDNGNTSKKWWTLQYSGSGDIIECNHGKAGSYGRKNPYQWNLAKCLRIGRNKLAKGYGYIGGTSYQIPKGPPLPPRIVLKGVFLEIRKIVEVAKDHFVCFDARGQFLLDLTETGAEQVASADTFRISLERL